MLFHNYLEKAIGSRVKIGILRAMSRFPERKVSGRELAKFTKNISHQAIAKSIKDLIDLDIINVEHYGTSQMLYLNKNHYLFDILRNLFQMEFNTINKLKSLLKNIPAKTIVLFGSIARGDENLESDIDLLIITNNKIENVINNKRELVYKIFGNSLMAYVMTEKEFKNKKNT
ncbi:MAG: nucleotidyltransferase domain-containing protein, partial [Nanoarchaeota archaeon]|nr:nucleotidyltransferase domain-containing protein [Nanoarchaeota archaeon]